MFCKMRFEEDEFRRRLNNNEDSGKIILFQLKLANIFLPFGI